MLHFINHPIQVTTLGITRLDAAEPDVVCLSSQMCVCFCIAFIRFGLWAPQCWTRGTDLLQLKQLLCLRMSGPLMDVFCCYVWLSCSYISINSSSNTSRLIFLLLDVNLMSFFLVTLTTILTNKTSVLLFFLFLSRLAESRTNPQVLDIGVNPQDINTEECLSPGKWDQEDTDFTAQKDTFGF